MPRHCWVRTTIILAAIFLIVSSASVNAGGPGRNLRPGLTRSTQVNALSPDGPKAAEPAGPIRTVVSFTACLAAILIVSLLKIDRKGSGKEEQRL